MYAIPQQDFRVARIPPRHTLTQRPTPVEALKRRLHPGEHLFYEADPASHVYEVASGALRLSRVQKDGRRQIIAFAFPGDVVGLPASNRHTTECEAVTTADVMARRYDPQARPDLDPHLHSYVMGAALDEIRMLQDHFQMLGYKSAAEKVSAFLLCLADRIGEPLGNCQLMHLPMNRADIADYLGLTPETVSRSITQFREHRLIALDDAQTVVILDADGLKQLTGSD